jgi:dTDP-4-dehydrorhamnose reductase
MDVLLLGGSGQLGRHLEASAPAAVRLSIPARHELDLTSERSLANGLDALAPDLVINAAAFTAVDRAEAEPEAAFAVNAEGPRRLARQLAAGGCRLIQLSTDFVFDGSSPAPYRPDDPPAPLNVYGASKLAGERAVLEQLGERALVVRTSWLYSAHRSNFVRTMLRALGERDEVRVVTDQVGSPTWAANLAAAIWRWALQGAPSCGRRHWADAGVASWYDFAVAICDDAVAAGLLVDPGRVVPIPTAEFPTAARRPRQSALDAAASRDELGLEPEHWRRALRRMLATSPDAAALRNPAAG